MRVVGDGGRVAVAETDYKQWVSVMQTVDMTSTVSLSLSEEDSSTPRIYQDFPFMTN
jgi:hypothetical protein